MRKTTIVSGFPGVGKSTLFNNPNGLELLDSDSSSFSWLNQADKIRHPNWPANYIGHIRENRGKVDLIFVSSHDVVRNALVEADIPFVLVYPGLDMKDEYIQRYIQRGNADAFVALLQANYENWIHDLMKQQHCIHVVLQHGQYLANVIEKIA